MTNTEGPESTNEIPADAQPAYVTTVPAMDGQWAHPTQAYRFLTFVADHQAAHDFNISGYSVTRQEGVADLVRNGLVEERLYTGGLNDGRRTLRLTELGVARLNAAREAAALIVIG